VAGRRAKLRAVRQGPRIRLKRLDRRDLRGVDVALGAEVARVTGGAGSGDSAIPDPRLLAMAFVPEVGSPMRGWRRESADVSTGEADRLDQRHVAGHAHAVRRLQVCGPDAVAVEAAACDCRAHLHGIASRLTVAGVAPERGIGRRPPDLLGVARVGELQVAGARRRRWRPLNPILDGAVVTIGAVRRLRPERGGGFPGSRVASHTGGEELAMLPVVEAVLRHPCQRGAAGERADDEEGDQACPEPHRLPARGRVRNAGGRRKRSLSLRRSRVTRACSRV